MLSAIQQGLVASAHDLSEGGLAVALAETLISGKLGAEVNVVTELRRGCSVVQRNPIPYSAFGQTGASRELSIGSASEQGVLCQASAPSQAAD